MNSNTVFRREAGHAFSPRRYSASRLPISSGRTVSLLAMQLSRRRRLSWPSAPGSARSSLRLRSRSISALS